MKTCLERKLLIVSVAFVLTLAINANGASAREPRADPAPPANVNLMRDYGWTDLHWAARHGMTTEAIRLLREGAAIDAREHLGRTPLHLAAMANHRDTAELLIARGADVNALDRWETTPLRRMELLRKHRGWDRSDMKSLLTDSGGIR